MLALSSEAVPRFSLDQLAQACRGRGLDGVELVVTGSVAADVLVARSALARVVALRAPRLDPSIATELARASRVLGAPVSVVCDAVEQLEDVVALFEAAGAHLLLAHGSDLDAALSTLAIVRSSGSKALGLAWELEPSTASLESAGAVLLATHEHLGLVRLHGGGPEQRLQDGRGVGPILGELALAGYKGPIVLCPSTGGEAIVQLWERWATSHGGAGCGHAVSTREHALDMRDVEPRDRLATILGAYQALIPGATLRLTLDHDPTCMYYTLEATEPPRSFDFRVTENGPEVWRAEVTKR